MPWATPAEGRDALGHVVRHVPYAVDLRVDHLVHGDEVGDHDVPVHVLERQVQVVERVQTQPQDVDETPGVLQLDAGNGVPRGRVLRHALAPSLGDLDVLLPAIAGCRRAV